MARHQKINVKFDNLLISNAVFNYLDAAEKEIIYSRLSDNESAVAGFYNSEKLVFAVVFDFELNRLHVRQVGGDFGRNYNLLDTFCAGLAKALGFDTITFISFKKAVARWAEKAGYRNIIGDSEYLKRVA